VLLVLEHDRDVVGRGIAPTLERVFEPGVGGLSSQTERLPDVGRRRAHRSGTQEDRVLELVERLPQLTKGAEADQGEILVLRTLEEVPGNRRVRHDAECPRPTGKAQRAISGYVLLTKAEYVSFGRSPSTSGNAPSHPYRGGTKHLRPRKRGLTGVTRSPYRCRRALPQCDYSAAGAFPEKKREAGSGMDGRGLGDSWAFYTNDQGKRRPRKVLSVLVLVGMLIGILGPAAFAADSSGTATPTDSPTPAATESPTPADSPSPTPTEAPSPTDTPTSTQAPSPTDAPSPPDTSSPSATNSQAPPPSNTDSPAPTGSPTISSDKADYAPGDTVVLTGKNWQPGETVHIDVNDSVGRTWSRDVDVTADYAGSITDTFSLPTTFVALYTVTADGAVSGSATTTFTDGNVNVRVQGGPTTAPVHWQHFSTTDCSGSATGSPNNGDEIGRAHV